MFGTLTMLNGKSDNRIFGTKFFFIIVMNTGRETSAIIQQNVEEN